MGDSLLSIENLKVSFSTENGVAEVLDGVNFSINSGEIVGLVGESGCGKTTLASLFLVFCQEIQQKYLVDQLLLTIKIF